MWRSRITQSSRAASLGGALALVLAAVVSGCAALPSTDQPGMQVVAGFYPLAYVVEQVAGPRADVVDLTAPGIEPHDVELSPRQVADISTADLVVFERGFQPAVDEAVDLNAEGASLDTTTVVPLRETGAPSEDGTDLDGDPHVWLDPTLLARIATSVGRSLAAADPPHASGYTSRAAELVDRLGALDDRFRSGLQDCQRRAFVTSHAAFGYLANRYDLTMVPIAGFSPDVEPSPQHLAEIADLVRSDGVTTIFSEALGTAEYAQTLADELGLDARVLDPVEGVADGSTDDYFSLMQENLRELSEANGCS